MDKTMHACRKDFWRENRTLAYFNQTAEVLPVGHVGHPKNVAESIVLGATNPDITGTVIECDGGMRLASMG